MWFLWLIKRLALHFPCRVFRVCTLWKLLPQKTTIKSNKKNLKKNNSWKINKHNKKFNFGAHIRWRQIIVARVSVAKFKKKPPRRDRVNDVHGGQHRQRQSCCCFISCWAWLAGLSCNRLLSCVMFACPSSTPPRRRCAVPRVLHTQPMRVNCTAAAAAAAAPWLTKCKWNKNPEEISSLTCLKILLSLLSLSLYYGFCVLFLFFYFVFRLLLYHCDASWPLWPLMARNYFYIVIFSCCSRCVGFYRPSSGSYSKLVSSAKMEFIDIA